jgi:hypothetical protein
METPRAQAFTAADCPADWLNVPVSPVDAFQWYRRALADRDLELIPSRGKIERRGQAR